MIKVELPNRTLGINFMHRKGLAPRKHWQLGKPTQIVTRSTKCEIVEIATDGKLTVLYAGLAFCDQRDNFKKETGRKIALTRAMQHASSRKNGEGPKWRFTAFERTAIWEAYFNRDVSPEVLKAEAEMRENIQNTADEIKINDVTNDVIAEVEDNLGIS